MKFYLFPLFLLLLFSGCNSEYADLGRMSRRLPFIKQLGVASTLPGFSNSLADSCGDIVVDRFENIICVGSTSSSMAQTTDGSADAFVAKFDRHGNTLWIKHIRSADMGVDSCSSVGVDHDGNIYCGGNTNKRIGTGSILNHGSPASIIYERPAAAADVDAFVAKLNPNGQIMWIKQFGSYGADSCNNIAVSPSGNTYCGARTDGEIGIDALTNQYEGLGATSINPLVAKIDTHGNLLWVRQFGTLSWPGQYTHEDYCSGVTIDDEENVYCVGGTRASLTDTNGSLSGDPNVPNGMDVFLWVLDRDGFTKHVEQVGVNADANPEVINVNSDESCDDIAVDKNKNIYCIGSVISNFGENGGGGPDGFILKWNSNFDLEWVTQMGATTKVPGFDNTLLQSFQGITLASDGSPIVIGYTLGPTAGVFAGANDILMLKFNSQGDLMWGRQFGNADIEICTNTTVDLSGNIYCTGYTSGSFGETNAGSNDALIMRVDPLGNL